MRFLAVLALAGCYNAHPAPGAPCDEAAPRCPEGQACIAGFCGGPPSGIDAPAGGDTHGTIDDRDGDGIPNATDNCPDLANADQANEDGDKFGDVCDPCPIEMNDTPTDPDGDGVADGCDPHPNLPGDKIAAFSGFASGVPSTWQVVGTVAAGTGEIALTTVAGNHTSVVAPGTIGNATLTVSLVVDQGVGMFDTAATITMPYDVANDNGLFCELYGPMASNSSGRYLTLWDSNAQVERGKNTFAWTTGTTYRLSLARAGNNYACSLTPPGGSAHTATGSTNFAPASSQAAVAMYGADARVQWMMVVTSP
jgi:hypothetical protein